MATKSKKPPPAMMTIDDLAYHLAVSTRHIEKMVKLGRVPPPIRIGKSARWLRTEIETWIADGCPQVDEKR